MAKVILNVNSYFFNPGSQQVDFSSFASNNGGFPFDFSRLYAIINVTAGVIIYSTAGSSSGLNGTYADPILTLTFNTTSMSSGDQLQIIYDAQNAPSATYDGTGTQPILSSTDPITGREGLDVNLLNSSFGGQLDWPLPSYTTSGYNAALSMGFINGGNLVAPKMDPATNELIVQANFAATATQNVNLTEVNGTTIGLGQTAMSNSLPVAIASDQTAIPITATTPLEVTVGQTVSQDILGVAVGGNRNNQIEISFNSAPSATLITNTFTGTGSAVATNGHTIYGTGTSPNSSARGISVQTVAYRPAHEIYAAFTAAFLSPVSTSYQRIGLYDNSDGFFIGYEGTSFGVSNRAGGSTSFTAQASFNVDTLTGASTSKFTRNGVPEALDTTKSNLFRIRFAWLGSANIYFEVFSPDAEWVLFHNIRQPNSAYNPSITNPNLPMQVDVSKTLGSNTPSIATACWGAGTTSAYSPITATLTDNTLAAMTRSVITGVTTGGGGGYVNVKVNPSGALVTDSTISGTVATSISNTFPELFVTGQSGQSALINNIIPGTASATATDITGYRTGYVQVVCSAGISSGAFIFEASNDNTNFQPIPVLNQSLITGAATSGAITALASTQIIYAFPVTARYIRLRISTAIVGGTIQAFSRFTQASYTPAITSVAQPTAAQLNATVSGSLTTVSTVTSVTGVTTVSAVTSAALSSANTIDIAGTAITTSQTSANIVTANVQGASFMVNVTALNAGTLLDVEVQETMENSGFTTYYTIYTFERISATGQYYSPVIKLSGSGLRYIRTVSGATPSITPQVVRVSRSGQAETIRRFINRTIDPNTLNSTTGSYFCEGVEDFNMMVRCTAQTTPATIALQFSMDNTNWFTSSSTATTAVGIAQAKTTNEQWKFVRAIVTAAGTGITLGEVTIGGHSA